MGTLNAEVLAMDAEADKVQQQETETDEFERQLTSLKKAIAHLTVLMRVTPEVRCLGECVYIYM